MSELHVVARIAHRHEAADSTEGELRAAVLRQLPEPPEGVDPAAVVASAIQELVDGALLIRT